MNRFIFCLMLMGTIACSQDKITRSDNFLQGEKLAELTDKKLREASGLAASRTNPGMLWTINDSGNGPEVFLIDTKLNIRLTCRLKDVSNRDWEDIVVGPGPVEGKSYVYVGEIGDNLARYATKHIYRFEEPVLGASDKMEITDFGTVTFRLSDKQKDTETLMIDRKTKNLYILSKRENPVVVYEIAYPYSLTDTIRAKRVASLPYSGIVAGDISPDGKEIVVKNYTNVYYWNNTAGKSLAALWKTPGREITYEEEPQGESITWAADGSGFYTLSEKTKKKKSFLYFYRKKK